MRVFYKSSINEDILYPNILARGKSEGKKEKNCYLSYDTTTFPTIVG